MKIKGMFFNLRFKVSFPYIQWQPINTQNESHFLLVYVGNLTSRVEKIHLFSFVNLYVYYFWEKQKDTNKESWPQTFIVNQ